jgi:cell division protein FtsB
VKSLTGVILIIVFIAAAVQLFHLYVQNRNLKMDLSEINRDLTAISKENVNWQSDLEYLENPSNLAKELRSKLNYKVPGEKLIIIVPPKNN